MTCFAFLDVPSADLRWHVLPTRLAETQEGVLEQAVRQAVRFLVWIALCGMLCCGLLMPHSICQVAPLGEVKIVLFEDGQETVFGAEFGAERALVLRHRSEKMVDLWNNILGASIGVVEVTKTMGLKDVYLPYTYISC